ncbi:MAG TPA: hypothetical protein H9663_02925 [Firmicutes bacterium]|nr:hypothetical protein [Bacillota bacterium]
MKKKTIAIAAMLLAASLCFGLAACGSGVSLKDFPAETEETAELGSVYELRTQVEGEDGTTYRLSSQVVTQDGGAVPVFENSFDVSDVSGYTITYTALISDTETQQSVVTLSVTDNTAPVININKPDDGIVNTEYRLPEISVSDLAGTQPAVTVKVYLVEGDSKTEVTGLTEREGRYYFSPSEVGSYQIEVTASKENGQSKTATRSFIVDNAVLEGEIFSPDVYDPAAQVSFTAGAGIATDKIDISTETSSEGDYQGAYLKFDFSQLTAGNWVDLRLTPRQEIDAYAEFDEAEFWVYFVTSSKNVKIGLLGGTTGDADPLMRTFPGNTWAKVSIDAETFFNNIGSKALFPINVMAPNSGNHANVTEVRLGAVMARYDFAPEVTVSAPEVTPGQTSSVTLTVATGANAFTAEIRDSATQKPVQSTISGNVISADLPIGTYTYTITSADERYLGSVSGTFSVNSNTQIVLPDEVDSGTAMQEYTIPTGQIWVDGAATQNVAEYSAVFEPAYGDAREENITSATYTPASSGKLTVTYTYKDAATQTLEITIDKAANTTGALLDMRNADVLEYVTASADTTVGYNAEGQYLTWTGSTNWRFLYINFNTTVAALQEQGYEYLKVQVYYQTDGATGNVTGWFCGKAMFGNTDTAENKLRQIPHDAWYTAYIPLSELTDRILAGSADFLQVGFDQGDGTSGHFPNVQEVRLKGFVPVTEPDTSTQFLDMSDDSVVDLFTQPSGTFGYVAENEGEQAYLSWQGTDNWQSLYFDPNTRATCNAETVYDYIAVELYYVSDSNTNGVSGYFLQQNAIYRNDREHAGLQANTWITVYLSLDMFYSSNAAAGTGFLLQCGFGQTNASGHFPNISEVRIGGMFYTNTPGSGETDYVITTAEA